MQSCPNVDTSRKRRWVAGGETLHVHSAVSRARRDPPTERQCMHAYIHTYNVTHTEASRGPKFLFLSLLSFRLTSKTFLLRTASEMEISSYYLRISSLRNSRKCLKLFEVQFTKYYILNAVCFNSYVCRIAKCCLYGNDLGVFFYCFTVHFNSLNLTYQLMHFNMQ